MYLRFEHFGIARIIWRRDSLCNDTELESAKLIDSHYHIA
jgi:hypothetical protein